MATTVPPASAPATPATDPPSPLNLDLPMRHATAPTTGHASPIAPQRLPWPDAPRVTDRARDSASHGRTTVAERSLPDGSAQAEVRTPWNRYCLKRSGSRAAELRDSPFDRALQSATCAGG